MYLQSALCFIILTFTMETKLGLKYTFQHATRAISPKLQQGTRNPGICRGFIMNPLSVHLVQEMTAKCFSILCGTVGIVRVKVRCVILTSL